MSSKSDKLPADFHASRAPVKELRAQAALVSTWILVDGKKVDIHSTAVDGKVISGFVESKVGAEFGVGYRLEMVGKPAYDIEIEVRVDGSKFRGEVAAKNQRYFGAQPDSPKREFTMTGRQTSIRKQKALIFAPLEFTHDPTQACVAPSILSGLGTIEVIVRKGKMTEHSLSGPGSSYVGPKDQAPVLGAFDEEEVDVTERARFGKETAKIGTFCKFEPVEGPDGVLCHFRFHYRSRDVLERDGIVDPEAPPAYAESSSGRSWALGREKEKGAGEAAGSGGGGATSSGWIGKLFGR